MRCHSIGRLAISAATLVMITAPTYAMAGNGPFFVLYDHRTHEPGEIEVMPMFDIASEPNGEMFLAYMVEVDLGLAERLQLDLMAEGHYAENEGYRATGFRIESRYRLFDRVPLNPVFYVEYEDLDVRTRYQMEVSGRHPAEGEEEEEPSGRPRERVLETRLILSDEVGPARLSFNWINESSLVDGITAFGYALGASMPLGRAKSEHAEHSEHGGHDSHAGTRVGIELYGAFGDTESFGPDPDTREHYASVNLMRHFPSGWMVKIAGSVGLTEVSRDLFRVGVGYEF
ncbi:MAG: hypothetical protein HY698_07565 [Deltaproteobacteria bacterium]|nr:hypothetical protein [Deltaproteobacteria bacterium]